MALQGRTPAEACESIKDYVKRIVGEFIVLPIAVYLWFRFLVGDFVFPDRVITACGQVVQVDSFLIAAVTLGYLWYWRILLRAIGPKFTHEIVVTIGFPLVCLTLSSFFAITGTLTANIAYLEIALFLTAYGVIVTIDGWNFIHSGLFPNPTKVTSDSNPTKT